MNVNLTPAEAALILTVLDNNTFAHSVFPMPDTADVMKVTLDIVAKIQRIAWASEQETHDARARKILEDL